MTRRTFGPIRIQMRVCQGMTRSVTDRWTSRLTFTCQKGRDGPVVSVRVDNRSFARSRRRVRTFSRSRRSTSFPPRADTYAPFESAFTVRFKVWKILRKQARVFSFFFLLVPGRGRTMERENCRFRVRGKFARGIDRPIDWRGTSRVDARMRFRPHRRIVSR